MLVSVAHSLSFSFVLFDVVVVNCSSLLSCTLHNAPLITAEWEGGESVCECRNSCESREHTHTLSAERSCCWFSLMGFYLFIWESRKYDASLYEGCFVCSPPPATLWPRTALRLHLTICAPHGNFYKCFAVTSALCQGRGAARGGGEYCLWSMWLYLVQVVCICLSGCVLWLFGLTEEALNLFLFFCFVHSYVLLITLLKAWLFIVC